MRFKTTSISLHPDDAGRIHHRIQALGMTRSEYVRHLIRQDIQRRPHRGLDPNSLAPPPLPIGPATPTRPV